MKALMYTGTNEVKISELPEPQLQPGTVKMRIDYCAICATDVHIVTHHLYNLPTPAPLGHEGSGVIIETSPEAEAEGWKVGDKIAAASMGICGKCNNCKRGDDVHCLNPTSAPMLTEYAVLPTNMIYRIPENEDVMKYCIAEPCASAMRGIDIADIKIGDTVLISGVGGIGAILLNMLLDRGATCVTAIDINEDKLTRAREMGAKHTINSLKEDIYIKAMEVTDGRGYDVIIEASGAPAAALPLLKCIANKGKVVYFAVFPMDYELPVNLYEMYFKEASLHTVFTTVYNYPRVMELIPQLQLDKILGPVYTLDNAEEAFWTYQKSIYPKIVVKCSNI